MFEKWRKSELSGCSIVMEKHNVKTFMSKDWKLPQYVNNVYQMRMHKYWTVHVSSPKNGTLHWFKQEERQQ